MKGFRIEDGQFVIRNGARVVATTEGKLTGFLPTRITLTPSLVFPDFAKDYAYHFEYLSDYNAGANAYGWSAHCNVSITAVPQEYAVETVLMAVPAGADIFFGTIQLSRSAGPSHTWLGATIDPLVPMGVAIPLTGSMTMEAGMGMARSLSVHVSGGNLIARIQQSVSAAPGGWGNYGDTTVGSGSDTAGGQNLNSSRTDSGGGTDAKAGIPIYGTGASPYFKSGSGTLAGTLPPGPQCFQFRRGFGNPCATADFTNYSSTYSTIISGRFGRQS